MGRNATKAFNNVYYKARINAAKYNDRFSSRESASLEVGVERTRLANIERNTKCPHPDEIVAMVDSYNSPELFNYYCSRQCPIGIETVQPIDMKNLETTAIKIYSVLKRVSGVGENILDIVEDGVIDASEKDDMDNIIKLLDDVSREVNTFKALIEKIERGEYID